MLKAHPLQVSVLPRGFVDGGLRKQREKEAVHVAIEVAVARPGERCKAAEEGSL